MDDTTAPVKQNVRVSELELREITPDMAEAVEVLLRKEAVHPLKDAAELTGHRLGFPKEKLVNNMTKNGSFAAAIQMVRGTEWVQDKHCYGLFAPGRVVPEVAVFVKLMQLPTENNVVSNASLTGDIRRILDKPVTFATHPNAAFFYTITNTALMPNGKVDPSHPVIVKPDTEDGMKAAESLITQVAAHLKEQYGIANFSTLSPVRTGKNKEAKGFAQWLNTELDRSIHPLLTAKEIEQLEECVHKAAGGGTSARTHPSFAITIVQENYDLLTDTQKNFFTKIMTNLGLYYLSEVKELSNNELKNPRDAVANVHLRNGAMIANVHWLPPKEVSASDAYGGAGLMVNYRYELDKLAERKAAFAKGTITMDDDLRKQHNRRFKELSIPLCRVRGCDHVGRAAGESEHLVMP